MFTFLENPGTILVSPVWATRDRERTQTDLNGCITCIGWWAKETSYKQARIENLCRLFGICRRSLWQIAMSGDSGKSGGVV